MSDSLTDIASGSGDTSKLSPEMRRMANAAKESARRNPGNSLWIERRKHRGPGFPFFLKQGERRKILVLTEPKVIVAHKFTTGWNNKGSYSFPETEYGVCDQWVPGDEEGFERTGKPCGPCMALGEPRSIMVFIIVEFYDEPREIKGKKVAFSVRPMIVDSVTPQNQLIDNAMTDVAGGSLRFCLLNVSRSSNQQSPRVGDSFTIVRKLSAAQLKKDKNFKIIDEAVKQINLNAAYKPLDMDEMKTALYRHRLVNDQHNNGDGYDPEGMAKAIKGNLEISDDGESSSEESSLLSDDSGGSDSLSSLADADEGTTSLSDADDATDEEEGFTLDDGDSADEEAEEQSPDTKAKKADDTEPDSIWD